VTFLLALCLAVLDTAFPCRGTLGPREPDPAVLAGLVKGRVLLCLVRNGMTLEQVEAVLGKGRVHTVGGCLSRFEADYDPYGVCVEYALPGRKVIGRSVYHLSPPPRDPGVTREELGTFAQWLQDQVVGTLGVTEANFLRLHSRVSEDEVTMLFGGPGEAAEYVTGRWAKEWQGEHCHVIITFSGEGAISGFLTTDDSRVLYLQPDLSSLLEQLPRPATPVRGPLPRTPFFD
jgi:hypothetical protein